MSKPDASQWGVFTPPVSASVSGWEHTGKYTEKVFTKPGASSWERMFLSPIVRLKAVPFDGWVAEIASGTGGLWRDYLPGRAYPTVGAAMIAVELEMAQSET